MKQLTVRGVDDSLHQLLREQAESQGVSVNRYILHILREAHQLEDSDIGKLSPNYHDLDHLAGTWDEDDEKEFAQELKKQRAIDGEMW